MPAKATAKKETMPKKAMAKAVKKAVKPAEAKKFIKPEKKLGKAVSSVVEKTTESAKKALTVAKKEKVAKEKAPPAAVVASGPMAQKWTALYKKAETIESKPYNMRSAFLEKTAIVHKVLGWGYILANRNDRLEVLFKDGIKYLISNYK